MNVITFSKNVIDIPTTDLYKLDTVNFYRKTPFQCKILGILYNPG
ncbi:hypothetical protein LEP1GSC088_2865 [Leptospira interrogans str. L1207]|nr:hypothetical protein LEP1GSC088_2865 [Leptospira interrogans str. L1207]